MDEGDRRTSGSLLHWGEFARPIAKEACSRAPVGGSGGYRTQQGADVKVNYEHNYSTSLIKTQINSTEHTQRPSHTSAT